MFGGTTPTGVPEAQPLTCFIKNFALVSVSSTSRFTPKAPGFSGFKIYGKKQRSFQELCTSLPFPCPAPRPPRSS